MNQMGVSLLTSIKNLLKFQIRNGRKKKEKKRETDHLSDFYEIFLLGNAREKKKMRLEWQKSARLAIRKTELRS